MTSSASVAHQYARDNRNSALESLLRLLSQPSISATGEGIPECAALVRDYLAASGLETRIIPTAGHPVVYGERIENPGGFTVLLYGHYDVQPAGPGEGWISPPFSPEIRDGRIYARGSGDNKGQFFAHIAAIEAYIKTLERLPVNVKFVIDGEEENGSPSLERFVREHRDLLRADLVYNADGGMHETGRPLVSFGIRGMLYVELTAKGPDRDYHSGNKGGVVPNPAWRLLHLMDSMRDEQTGRVLIEGFYDDVRPMTPFERELLARIPLDPEAFCQEVGIPSLGSKSDPVSFYEAIFLQPTLNISGLSSGYGGPGMKTIIPSKATAKIDMRLAADQDPEDILAKFRRHVARVAPDVTVIPLAMTPPSRTPADLPVARAVVEAVRSAQGAEPVVIPGMDATNPEYVWTRLLGVPSVTVPYANFDENNHSPNENMSLELFYKGIHTTIEVLDHLGRM